MLGNRQDAEEAVQDIFMKVHRGIAGFRGDSHIRTWLYRITVNTCLTRLRKTPAPLEPEPPGSMEQWEAVASDEHGPDDQLIEEDLREFILKGLEMISPAEKEILLLFHIDGMKYEEIARVLEVPTGTVCVQIYRARKKLRAALGDVRRELTR
jgi:RNA polymerase sigma-70 factor (ECF subfamily)